jgi:hypothetical protein
MQHVPAATNTHTTIELLLETVFFTRSVQSGFIRKTIAVAQLVVSQSPASKAVSTEAEGCPLLEGITREQLMT